ncbi:MULTISPECIES: 1-propanol dehydrogenase PduQ [unclassified Romboutsia]|uniref:1-propanol dehydrogenase PduQ n=1 Tax=unclassified Romboutsia TaxID=2626894 RepID=UPI0008231FFC|nr:MULTISPECIES: 1-propanol dehydrogenase PduQ [unclassified Romboutsia]SCI25514.1 NAD-dependent methanol dehydrogenase [uncultured Clostridium sp.]
MNEINAFYINPKISYGENSLCSLKEFGFTRVCIATDKFMTESKLIHKVTDILDENNIDYHIFDEITPDPSTNIIQNGLSHIVNLKPHALIAVGGGSVIDAAKAIMYFCIQLKKNFIDEDKIEKPYFIAIPTTAGTGSEVTNFAVITDNNSKSKIPLRDDIMLPDEAILDPKLTASVPKNITASTAMDVLTHGIESYISTNNNIFSQMYALESIKLVSNNLLKCYRNLNNLEYRSNLQIASCMAGIAFNSSGLGITHSIAHSIGSEFHLPHGLCNAIILPFVIEYNGKDKNTCNKYLKILDSIGLSNVSIKNAPLILKTFIIEINKALEIPLDLKSLNISKSQFKNSIDSLAQTAYKDICTLTNPVKTNINDLKSLIQSLY